MAKTNQAQLNKLSKFLSLILRHQPQEIGLTLDAQGWAEVDELINKINASNRQQITRPLLQQLVDSNDKKRFIISEDGLRIRANQGHSIKVDLNLKAKTPPPLLYHGTATRFVDSIMAEGLTPQQRHHVHLSHDVKTAKAVGRRYGILAMLTIDAQAMHEHGHVFYQSENGVWLTDKVPVQFLSVITDD